MKTKIVILFMITTALFFTGCGKEVDDVINEMTLKGTVDRGEKTIKTVKDFQKQYVENLKELQKFDNPTNTSRSAKKTK